MRRLFRFMVRFAIVWGVLWVLGQIASRAFAQGSTPDDDEFRLLGFLGGRRVASTARALRKATVQATLGGVDLDLRKVGLDPRGAHLSVSVVGGGMRITVPSTWKVYAAEDVRGGAVEVDVIPPDELPDDAPALTVEAVVRSGGVVIESR